MTLLLLLLGCNDFNLTTTSGTGVSVEPGRLELDVFDPSQGDCPSDDCCGLDLRPGQPECCASTSVVVRTTVAPDTLTRVRFLPGFDSPLRMGIRAPGEAAIDAPGTYTVELCYTFDPSPDAPCEQQLGGCVSEPPPPHGLLVFYFEQRPPIDLEVTAP